MFKKIFVSIFCLVSFLNLTSIVHAQGIDSEEQKLFVTFKTEVDYNLLQEVGAEIVHRYKLLPAVSILLPVNERSRLESNSQIASVVNDVPVTITEQNSSYGINLLKVPNSWSSYLTGKDVKIAVIDTGISTTHPDLKIAGGKSFVPGVTSYNDNDGHGTHVAGIIAAQNNNIGSVGVAPNVKLYALKVADGDVGDASALVSAVEWSIENHMDIINISMASDTDFPPLKSMLDKANQAGILVVAAAGNSEGKGVKYPAKYNSVIAVTAVDSNESRASFSAEGPKVELAAPGVGVYSTYEENGINTYKTLSGTSMAAPYVTGILALFKEAHPNYNIGELRDLIDENAKDLGTPGRDTLFGFGLVQAPQNIFIDLAPNYLFSKYVNYLYSRHIVFGYTCGEFKPQSFITRSEAAVIIGRMLGMDGAPRNTSFIDVQKDNFGSGYIQGELEKGIITGYKDGTFRPNVYIDRGEMAMFVAKAFNLSKEVPISYQDVKPYFPEYNSIKELQAAGIVEGFHDRTFRPYEHVSRGEMSAFLARGVNIKFKLNKR